MNSADIEREQYTVRLRVSDKPDMAVPYLIRTVIAQARRDALNEAADWLEGIGLADAAYLLRTCDIR